MDLSQLIERNAAFTPDKAAVVFEEETLSYSAFLMLAGALLLGAVWAFLLRYVPDVINTPAGLRTLNADLVRAFADLAKTG